MGMAADLGETLANLVQATEKTASHGEFFRKDSEFLQTVGTLPTPELTEKITGFLKDENRPGSVELMSVFTDSTILDAELSLLAEGRFNTQEIEAAGLPVMIDAAATTQEMMRADQVMLTEEAHSKFLGGINLLKFRLNQHINKTAQQVSDHYAEWLTREPSLTQRLKGLFGIKEPNPYEITLTTNEQESQRLSALSAQKYPSREDATNAFRRELLGIATKRPEAIGLKQTGELAHRLETMANGMGNNANDPVEISPLRSAHWLLKGAVMDELQIHPGFGDAIEKSVKKELLEHTEV